MKKVIIVAAIVAIMIAVFKIAHNYSESYRYAVSENLIRVNYHDNSSKLLFAPTKKIVVENLGFIYMPLSKDSLAVFSSGTKRGYINIYTGEVVVPATEYSHAWVFSEGMAAVERDGYICFINTKGEIVLKTSSPYDSDMLSRYAFHHGVCIMLGENRKFGLIDTTGNWIIQPEYSGINLDTNYMILSKRGEPKKQVAYDGTVINAFLFDDSHRLTYSIEYEDKEYGGISFEDVYVKGVCVYSVDGMKGLMTEDARIITKPIYTHISAHSNDVFKATLPIGVELWLNPKGEVLNR